MTERDNERKKLLEDVGSVLLGLVLCGAILGVLMNPGNRLALMLLFFSGAAVNMLNGWKLYRKPKQRNQGMSMILLGVVILVIGFYVLASGAV